jgi:hypothetical protein
VNRTRRSTSLCACARPRKTDPSLTDLLLFEVEEAPGVPFGDVVEVSTYVAAVEGHAGRGI